jgi:hypothetical protein
MTVGLNYHIEKAQMFFPPKAQASGGTFSLGETRMRHFYALMRNDIYILHSSQTLG